MYVIIVYDVNQKRVQRLCKYLRQYLNWVQNSVFEGFLTESQLARVRKGILSRIKESDSVYIYKLPDDRWLDREIIGQMRMPTDAII